MNANVGIPRSVAEEKYAKVFQLSSNLLSLSAFSDGRFVEVNDAFLKKLGFAREEVIGKTAFELGLYANPGDREKLMQATMAGTSARDIMIQVRAKNGAIYDCLFATDLISIDDVKYWLVEVNDISALKRAMIELQENTALYRQIVNLQTELVCRYRVDGKLSFVNDCYARYFGKSQAELVGTNFIPHIPEPDLTLIARELATITRERPCVVFEHRVIMPDGAVRWQQWSHQGVYAADGRLLEYQAVGRDITTFKMITQRTIEAVEKKFIYMFEHAADGVALIDPGSRKILNCNHSLRQMLGYNEVEIFSLTLKDVIPERDVEGVLWQFRKQLQDESSLMLDVPLKKKNGEELYAEVSASLFDVGSIKYMAFFFRDITERRVAALQLACAHRQLQAVINAASQVAIIATDVCGKIAVFNVGAERMLGYSASEMIGQQTPMAFHLASEVRLRARALTTELGYPVEGFDAFVAYAKIGKFDEREWTYVRKDGSHLSVDLIVTAIKDEADKITGFLGVAIDITDRKRVMQAQASSAAKSQFVANISHEIRTPLSGIVGVCELLHATRLSKVQAEYMRIISSSAETLSNVINATLDFAKIESGNVLLEHVDFNLREIVEEVVSVLAPDSV